MTSAAAAGRPAVAWPGARTELVGVVGDPVRHSLSPLLHNAAFAALGLDWAYVAFPVARSELAVALAGARALGLRGLSVTMPHKEAIARAADQRSRAVERLGAANTVVLRSGIAVAETTDGVGLLDDLREGAGFDASGLRCAVVGAGGAARAVVLALAEAGARSVVVVNRTADRAAQAAALAGSAGRVGTPGELADVALVVQATPAGMPGAASGAARPGEPARPGLAVAALARRLGAGQLVVDLVYHPPMTPFLAEAASRGATVRNGLGMLVHQAAHQCSLWTGESAPLEAMWAAVGGRTAGRPVEP
ncbi:MAG TPA: shikimate dehydrogenase [Acidimicrobiales bacterium]|nr:shikimate dehydrogenase [Acidimicrobiales bacterium]